MNGRTGMGPGHRTLGGIGDGQSGGSPGGSGITEITSSDGSIFITDPTGPVTDLIALPPTLRSLCGPFTASYGVGLDGTDNVLPDAEGAGSFDLSPNMDRWHADRNVTIEYPLYIRAFYDSFWFFAARGNVGTIPVGQRIGLVITAIGGVGTSDVQLADITIAVGGVVSANVDASGTFGGSNSDTYVAVRFTLTNSIATDAAQLLRLLGNFFYLGRMP